MSMADPVEEVRKKWDEILDNIKRVVNEHSRRIDQIVKELEEVGTREPPLPKEEAGMPTQGLIPLRPIPLKELEKMRR